MSGTLVERLISRGVEIPCPSMIWVAEDVDPARIEAGAQLLPGATIRGSRTLIRSGSVLGGGGPTMVSNCGLGRNVRLHSGTFEDAVFLDGSSFGPSGHVRDGTLFEEGASAAHAVGTKQTILMPWATLGSNINACDLLLAGGTGPSDHSEIGSGFIHFNFTPFGPKGDKATPSRFGDAIRGVWLRQPRIFLGGAGGIVGPVHIGYGTVLAAGAVYRRDRGEGLLVVGETFPAREGPFDPKKLSRAGQKVRRNFEYLGALVQLRAWYREVRLPRLQSDPLGAEVVKSGVDLLNRAIRERVQQLARYVSGFEASAQAWEAIGGSHHPEASFQRRLFEGWTGLEERLLRDDPAGALDPEGSRALRSFQQHLGPESANHIDWVRQLSEAVRAEGLVFLEAVGRVWWNQAGLESALGS